MLPRTVYAQNVSTTLRRLHPKSSVLLMLQRHYPRGPQGIFPQRHLPKPLQPPHLPSMGQRGISLHLSPPLSNLSGHPQTPTSSGSPSSSGASWSRKAGSP